MEETSLEDFLEDADSRDEPPDGDGDDRAAQRPAQMATAAGGDPTDADATDPDATDDAVAQVAPTSAWTPQGAECEYCGATVERRWRDGDALACVDCVDW